jgi:hypothetical protein
MRNLLLYLTLLWLLAGCAHLPVVEDTEACDEAMADSLVGVQ